MNKKILLSLSFAFLGATFGFANLNSEMEESYGCVNANACGVTVVVCGDTLDELNEQQSEWEDILGCAEEEASIEP